MRSGAALALVAMTAGCSAGPVPENRPGAAWQPGQGSVAPCTPIVPIGNAGAPPSVQRLAPGDRIRIELLGDENVLTGSYVVAPGGTVTLPSMAPVAVGNLPLADAGARIAAALRAAGKVRAMRNAVSLRLLESAAVKVSVSGAVFVPGAMAVGERTETQRTGLREANGDANPGRTLTAALRAAGGVRPDADVTRVMLERDGSIARFDLSGAIMGASVPDIELSAGDRVTVGTRGCFDAALVRPSAITLGGVRVYMSNLTRPANNNAGGAVGKESGSMPYGSRLLQALVSMNCVGGSAMNARRHAVLISRNPATGQSIVIERAVEELVRKAGRDAFDPYLMPEDAIACYDSRWMNFADAVGFLGNAAGIATPAILISRGSR